jgi:regulator of replication initiation timing
MIEEATSATGTQAGPETQPPAGTPPTQADGGSGEQQSPAAAEAISLEEAKKLRAEAQGLRRRLATYEEEKRAAEEAKLSETERLTRRASDLERQLAERDQSLKERTVLASTIDAAARLGFANPRLAHRLLDHSEIEFEADGNPSNIEALLRGLLAAEPYLASAHARPTGSIDGGSRGNRTTLTREAIEKMSPAEISARSDEIDAWLASQGR